jgi:hypothetical protein
MSGELITGDGQVQFDDYLLGDDLVTYMDALNGWEGLPGIDSGNTPRPNYHGSWPGYKFAQERIITWEGRFAASPSAWVTELKKLRQSLAIPLGSEEYEIAVRLRGETLLAFGTVSARAMPGDYSYGYYGARLTIQFECSDPRRYSLDENIQNLILPTVSSNGLDYPLDYPLDYGADEASSGSATIQNDGDVTTPVKLIFTGPMTNPKIVNVTTGVSLEFIITLGDGETLEVDTRIGTVLLNGIADRLYTRTVNSSPILSFGLVPGSNTVTLQASAWDDPAGVTIIWRDATL